MSQHILLIGENVEAHAAHFATEFTVHTLTGRPDRQAYLDEIAPLIEGIGISGGADPRCDEALLDRLPNLSIVCALGVGYATVDADAVKARGIMATHGPGTNAASVAEFALGLMLAVTRRMIFYDGYARAGRWAATGSKGGYTATVSGKTVGIIGLGHIGRQIAKRAEAFDMTVLYHQRHRNDAVPFRYVDTVGAMAADCQYLVTCCPATAETRHLVDASVLKALGPDGYLIGISRGSVVDEQALIAALTDGVVAGAGLEVFETEPDIRPELTRMDNVVLSPHRAAFTHEATLAMRDLMMANFRAHFAGEKVPTPIPGFEKG